MNRRAFALALLSTASLACGGEADPAASTTEAASELQTFAVIGKDGACATKAPGRAGAIRGDHVRIRFSEGQAGDLAMVEFYDGQTGVLREVSEYHYKRLSSSEVEIFYYYTGERTVAFRLHLDSSGDGGMLHQRDGQNLAPTPITCDLRAKAPKLKLPIVQEPADTEEITGSFPPPPDRGWQSGCTATSLVDGKFFRLRLHRKRGASGLDWVAAADLYGKTSRYLESDALAERDAVLVDENDKLAIVSEGDRVAEIVLKTIAGKKQLALVPIERELKTALGAQVPLRCDFVGE